MAPSPKYLLTCYFSSQLMDCQEFIKHSSQNKNASPAICKREPRADPSRTRVPCVWWISLGNLQAHLYVLKNSQSFFFNPQSTIFSFNNFEVLLSSCSTLWLLETSTSEKWEQEACPQLSGFMSTTRVHVHHRGSHPPSGFMSTVGVHVHPWGSRPLSGFMSTVGVHVHRRGSRPPSGFTSTVIPVEMTRRGGVKGWLSIHLMWLASNLEPSCLVGSYDTQTNMQATLYWGTEGAKPKDFLNEIITKELKIQPGKPYSVHLYFF